MEPNEKQEAMPRHLDLFSGIGGFAIAAQRSGFQTVGFCEIEPYARQILIEKFCAIVADSESAERSEPEAGNRWKVLTGGGPQLFGDIRKLDGRRFAGVDLLTGGFPCQPFSQAGKRRGKEDDRHLWPEMLRIIAEAKPAWILGENVAGIIGMELDVVLSDLESQGYSCGAFVIPACAVDARHRRDRVWIVANAYSSGFQGRNGKELRKRGRKKPSRSNDPSIPDSEKERRGQINSDGGRPGEGTGATEERGGLADCCEWSVESGFCRVADGIPNRAHRLRALGNAIVPQVAEVILRGIRSQIR